MIRILLVAAAASTTGGGERHVADLLRLLPRRGCDLALACPAGGDLSQIAQSAGIPWIPLGIEQGFSVAEVRRLRRGIVELAPDVVHAHGSRAAFYARLADPEAAARVVYTLHGIHVDKAGSALRRALLLFVERVLRRRTRRFVTVCESDQRTGARLGMLDPARAHTVYNGVEAHLVGPAAGSAFRAEIGTDSGVPLVLSVGRFVEPKDQHTLLAAWRDVVAAEPAAVLALIGSGPLEADLHAAAASLRIADSVRFLPPRPDLRPAYAAADVFAMSSRWEGLPYVVLEAMLAGLPVASTAVDGIPEAVVHGESGLLVPPRDPSALSGAILELLTDRERADRLGQAARTRVSSVFTYDTMVDGLMRVYAEVVEAPA
ncbi:MAG: glycosyltransferase [Coriobacteriia bacterium]